MNAGFGDWALEVHSTAVKGRESSPDLCAALVKMLVKADRLEEATAILKVISCLVCGARSGAHSSLALSKNSSSFA